MSWKRKRGKLRWLPGVVLLLLLVGSSTAALAKKPGSVNPMPTVILLLDTSTSMQYSVDALNEAELPTCHDTRVDGFNYSRSRWAVTVETLTGSFYSYWCSLDDRLDDPSREDYNHTNPHVIPKGVAVDGKFQRVDGLIDIYRDQFKFGLMTFDPKAGTGDDASGGFSYGPSKTTGIVSNLGIHSENADWGGLVAPAAEDALGQVRKTNDEIQDAILAARPYAGSPLGPALEDALYFFEHDSRVKPYNEDSEKGDPYYDCRSKSIIFITDGQPNLGEGTNGYPTSPAAAAKLLAAGITVYVVGFDLPPGTFPVLNEIAEAGGSDSAYIANSQAELTSAIGSILVSVRGNQASSVDTAVTNRTLRSGDKQYQFNASFSGTPYTPLDETGHLDQYVYRCQSGCTSVSDDDTSAALCEVYSISDALANRLEERVVQTQIDGQVVDFSIANTQVTADMLAIPDHGDLSRLDPYELPSGEKVYSGIVLGDATDPLVREQYRQQLIRLIRADAGSRRENVPLGAINHSQPVIQTNVATISAPIPSFIQYRNLESVRYRPTVLFTGTHDGQMHAFRVDRLSTLSESDYGEELWSFIPKTLLAQLNNLAAGTLYLMDGEPVVEEVRLYKESLDLSLEDEVERWRSVLLSGYGQGGRGYFALNVTDPTDYEFMWELSNSELCFNIPGTGSGCGATTDFERLGYTYSRPAIGTAFLNYETVTQERSVAIFGAGGSVSGEAESGKAVYVVDLQSGQLIREFCNSCGNVVDTNEVAGNSEFIDCPMIGDVMAYDNFPGSNLTRAFIGDECGQLWRLDMASADPDDWRLEFFHDGLDVKLSHKKRRPIDLEPALATSYSPGRLVVVYATGSPDEPLQPSARDYIFSVSEYWDGDGFIAKENWRIQLEKRETVTAAPLIFNKVAYFGTQASSSGYCATGDARLWGIDFDGLTDGDTDDVIGAMDEDGSLLTTQDLVEYITYQNSEVVGLEVTQRPVCIDGLEESEPWLDAVSDGATVPGFGSPYPGADGSSNGSFTGSSGGGSLELVVQTGTSGASSPSMSPPAGGGVVSTGAKSVQKLSAPAQTIFSTSWGLVFD
jgi:hypothetical protein